jgi:hypothetical protein
MFIMLDKPSINWHNGNSKSLLYLFHHKIEAYVLHVGKQVSSLMVMTHDVNLLNIVPTKDFKIQVQLK